jgi:DNA transformation protein and related proteins
LSRYDDLFAPFGRITAKRFFGGEGLYAGAVMIGAVFDDIVYFKTDEETRKPFLAEKCKPFTFEKGGKTVVTTWFAIPDRLYDDPDALAEWARAALRVAEAAPSAQKKRKRAVRQK